MAKDKARIAIIGTGWWATTAHVPSLMKNPDAELVALADLRADVLAKAADAASNKPKTYTDYREMLAKEKPDGVVIATNHTAHYQNAKDALEAGVHVLLEKPMVLEARHAHDLESTAKAKGVELIVGYPWHFTKPTNMARDIILSGELGTIQYVSCLFTSMVVQFLRGNDEAYRSVFNYPVTGPGKAYSDPATSGGGQGHLQVTHSAGSLFFVTELQPERVSSFMDNWDTAVDVIDAISVRFQPKHGHRAIGVLGSTANIGKGGGGEFNLNIYCEHGYLFLDQLTGTLRMKKGDDPEQIVHGALPAAETYPSHRTSENLVGVIVGKEKNGSPAHIGVRVVELLDAAYRSAANDGAPVNVSDL